MTDILNNPPALPERNWLIEGRHPLHLEGACGQLLNGNLGSLNIHILDGGKPTIVTLTPSQF